MIKIFFYNTKESDDKNEDDNHNNNSNNNRMINEFIHSFRKMRMIIMISMIKNGNSKKKLSKMNEMRRKKRT